LWKIYCKLIFKLLQQHLHQLQQSLQQIMQLEIFLLILQIRLIILQVISLTNFDNLKTTTLMGSGF